jgi:P27 family predicted phage terminase small subunit
MDKDAKRILDMALKGVQPPANNSEPPKTPSPKEDRPKVVPACKLSRRERAYFNAVVSFLDERGLLETVDSLLLSMLAKNVALWRDIAERVTSADDLVQHFENGATNVSAMQTAKDKAENAILKISSRLGLSPLDRAKLFGAAAQMENTKNNKNDGDALDEFLG